MDNARPKTKDGYTRIANELLDALMLAKISHLEQTTMLAIIRKTYGWNRKRDEISNTLLANITGKHRSNISRAITSLECKNMIVVSGDRNTRYLEIQKDYIQWNVDNSAELLVLNQHHNNKKQSRLVSNQHHLSTDVGVNLTPLIHRQWCQFNTNGPQISAGGWCQFNTKGGVNLTPTKDNIKTINNKDKSLLQEENATDQKLINQQSVWDVGEKLTGSRSQIGKLVKQYGQVAVGQAIDQTQQANPADARGYLQGVLKAQTQNNDMVFAAYHQHLPDWPQPCNITWSNRDNAQLAKRKQQHPDHNTQQFWNNYFAAAARAADQTGFMRDGVDGWKPDLQWLLQDKGWRIVHNFWQGEQQ